MAATKFFSKLFSFFPEGWLKDRIRLYLYNRHPDRQEFSISKNKKIWIAKYPGFELKFEDSTEPYHVLLSNYIFLHHFPDQPVDLLVDAGAFIGSFSIYAIKKYPQVKKVLALEPDPLNFSRISKNITLNSPANIELLPLGLWDKKDTLTFFPNQQLASSVYSQEENAKASIKIEVDSLDDLVKGITGKRIFIKMNIEGAELAALAGCAEIIRNNKVHLAIAADHLVEGELTQHKVEALCRNMNLSVTTFKRHPYITVYASNEVIYPDPSPGIISPELPGEIKKKVLYISNVNMDGPYLPGVIKKIKGQLSAFDESGFDIDMLYPGNDQKIQVITRRGERLRFKGARQVRLGNMFSKLITHARVAWYGSINFRYCFDFISKGGYDALYLRFYLPGTGLVKFLTRFKKKNPATKILLEYPTLNVVTEFQKRGLASKINFWVNKRRIDRLNQLADTIVTLTKDKTLFGKPTVFMANGIDFREIGVIHPVPVQNEIRLLGVTGDCNFYHGYDKILQGLSDYNKTNPATRVSVKIISNPLSKYLDTLKRQVQNLGISSQVIFEHTKTGQELVYEYKQAHLGIGTLALHRINLMDNYSLKHREYAAFGLPFIMSKGDDHFENSPFVYTIERDEDPVNIQRLVEFFLSLQNKYPDYPAAFRRLAEAKLSWQAQLQDVFGVIRNN